MSTMKRNNNKQNWLIKWWDKNKPDTFLKELKEYSMKKRIAIMISSLFFAIYFFISFGIFEAIISYKDRFTSYPVLFFLVLVSIIFIISIIFLYMHLCLLKLRVNGTLKKPSKSQTLSIVVFSFGIMLGVFLLNFPTNVMGDIIIQMNQAQSGVYNNWHPVMHTLLFYKLPISIFGNSYNVIGVFQYTFVALIIAYTGYSFCSFGLRPIVFYIMTILMVGNKVFLYIIDYPWKDIPYSFSILLLTVNCMWIFFTNGEWLRKKRNILLLAVSSFFVLFMRHNGILSFVVTFIALIIAYKPIRKILLSVFISMLALYFVVTIPIYSLLGVIPHTETFAEKLGVPNNQIAYIVANDGDISEDEIEFIDQYISVDAIKKSYVNGNFNSVKWTNNYHAEFLEENKFEYIKVWFSLVKKNFGMAVKAYYYTTKSIWRADINFTDIPFYSMGFIFFLAALSISISSIKQKRRFISFLPLLINVLGIMCLITGGETRFVFSNLTTCIPLIMFSFIQLGNKTKNDERLCCDSIM